MFWKKSAPKTQADRKPVLIWVIGLIGLALAIVAHSVFGSTSQNLRSPVEDAVPVLQASTEPAEVPPGLQTDLEQLARGMSGKNAVLVRSIDERWTAGHRGATTFPQGSLRRLWLGAALLDAVDHGELSLDQRVPLLSAGRSGAGRTEVLRSLLQQAISDDDRVAQDHILEGLTGPAGMAGWLEERGFDEIAFGPSYREMARRKQASTAVTDGATPDGIAFALGEIFAGRALKAESTQLLFDHFTGGPESRSATASGWQVLRLVGSSPANGPVTSAGAVAVIRSRTGQRYAIVVFASGAGNPEANRDRLLSDAVSALERRVGR